jgi:hypothetical protein
MHNTQQAQETNIPFPQQDWNLRCQQASGRRPHNIYPFSPMWVERHAMRQGTAVLFMFLFVSSLVQTAY